MDGAATQVDQLAQHLLPAQPHHLALSLTERYPPTTDFRRTHSRLQYTTFVSGADRGVLLTRAYYEILEEPDTLAPTPADAASRPDVKKAVTKVSFKDYRQNKQKKVSESPPDTGPSASMDTKQTNTPKIAERRPIPYAQDANGAGSIKENKRSATAVTNGDRNRHLSPTERSKPSPSPLADGKKRTAEPDFDVKPPKRAKSDSFTKPDATHPSQQNSSRNKEAGADTDEKRRPKEARHAGAQGTPNGRSLAAAQKGNGPTSSSPRPAVNGVKGRSGEDRHSTPRTGDPPGKASLPPLLSPLHLGLDDDHDRDAKSPKKEPPENGGEGARLKPSARTQGGVALTARPTKSPLRVPPLLSPTLPPIVEQELARVKRTPSKGDSSQHGSQASESPRSAKKPPRPVPDAEDERERDKGGEKEKPEKTGPKRLMVTLKFRKRLKWVQQLLALQPASQKEALRKERSISVDGTPPPSRKRPPLGDTLGESPSSKRARLMADKTISAKPLPPSTPLKTTAMSRAASSTSQAVTPGDTASLTPGGPSDRPSTSQGDVPSNSSALLQRSERYTKLGTRLKHDRDAIVKPRLANGASTSGREQPPKPPPQLHAGEKKKVAALSIEMILSYMVSFRLLNQARAADRKSATIQPWDNLLLHFKELRGYTRHYRVLEALAVQLHALCLEQMADALTTHEAARVAPQLASVTRRRLDAWAEAFHGTESVTDASMKVVLGPWHTVEDGVRLAMPVLRRWAAREAIDYEMELTLPPNGGGG